MAGKILTQAEVAERLRMSVRTVYQLRVEGRLRYIPGRPVRFLEDDVEKFIETSLQTGPASGRCGPRSKAFSIRSAEPKDISRRIFEDEIARNGPEWANHMRLLALKRVLRFVSQAHPELGAGAEGRPKDLAGLHMGNQARTMLARLESEGPTKEVLAQLDRGLLDYAVEAEVEARAASRDNAR